jgi:hypothetical protein
MKEVNEKTIRLRYIRLLEKFSTKAIGLLKLEEFDLELYKKAMLKTYDSLQKAKSVPLYSEYPAKLREFVQLILDTLDIEPKKFEDEVRDVLLKEYNLLQKLKNKGSYKKDKHKHKKFNDGY